MQQLIDWKQDSQRKPLLIQGARQVGKTWLMRSFGKEHFQNVAYLSMDQNPRLQAIFTQDFDIDRIIEALQIESQLPIDENTLLIFDEIQEIPLALQSLKYFQEQHPELPILAAGSLLGVALHSGISFPVGKIQLMDMYPLSFLEFLDPVGNEELALLIRNADFQMMKVFRDKFILLLKQYFYLGGMPEVVQEYIKNRDYEKARKIQKDLIRLYEYDFSKHTSGIISERLRLVYNSIPAHLGQENKKFIYGHLRSGARSKDYEDAIQWLVDCGLAIRVSRVSKPGLPLSGYAEPTAFKLFLNDVGLLSAMCDLDARTLLEGSKMFEEYKGSLTEQYILTQLVSELGLNPFYYSEERSTGDIDFLVQLAGRVIPIEVKAAENLQAKSLKAYAEKYKPNNVIRTSLSDYRKEDWLINLPLYAISSLRRILK
jgi:predicted AAA+ superfamily ATPase